MANGILYKRLQNERRDETVFELGRFLTLEVRLLDTVITAVRQARASGVQSVDGLQKAVTVDELRGSFAHGDPDLESRCRSRVAALVAFLAKEAASQQ